MRIMCITCTGISRIRYTCSLLVLARKFNKISTNHSNFIRSDRKRNQHLLHPERILSICWDMIMLFLRAYDYLWTAHRIPKIADSKRWWRVGSNKLNCFQQWLVTCNLMDRIVRIQEFCQIIKLSQVERKVPSECPPAQATHQHPYHGTDDCCPGRRNAKLLYMQVPGLPEICKHEDIQFSDFSAFLPCAQDMRQAESA